MNRRAFAAVLRPRRGRSCVLGREGQRGEDALGAGQSSLDRLPLFAQRRDRLEDALKENQERRQGAERDAERFERRARPGPQQGGDRQRRQHGGDGRVQGGEACGTVRRRQRFAEHLAESSDRFALTAERANDLDASQALLQPSRERPDRDARRSLGLTHAHLQEAKRDHERRCDQGGHQGEGGTEHEHPDREGQEAHQIRHENGDARREHGVHGFDVRRAAADEIAHRCPVEVAHGEPLNMRNEADAQTAEHALGDRRGEVAVEERHRLDGGAGSEIEDREQEQAGRPADEQMVVDDCANDERGSELERRGGEHEHDDGDGSCPPGLQQVRQIAVSEGGPAAWPSPVTTNSLIAASRRPTPIRH
jgi:hypothetical protein